MKFGQFFEAVSRVLHDRHGWKVNVGKFCLDHTDLFDIVYNNYHHTMKATLPIASSTWEKVISETADRMNSSYS